MTTPNSNGWWSLVTTIQLRRDPLYLQPHYTSCPKCGEPYRTGPDSYLYCKYDGYRPGPLNEPTDFYTAG